MEGRKERSRKKEGGKEELLAIRTPTPTPLCHYGKTQSLWSLLSQPPPPAEWLWQNGERMGKVGKKRERKSMKWDSRGENRFLSKTGEMLHFTELLSFLTGTKLSPLVPQIHFMSAFSSKAITFSFIHILAKTNTENRSFNRNQVTSLPFCSCFFQFCLYVHFSFFLSSFMPIPHSKLAFRTEKTLHNQLFCQQQQQQQQQQQHAPLGWQDELLTLRCHWLRVVAAAGPQPIPFVKDGDLDQTESLS
jgi:hypothetical protein